MIVARQFIAWDVPNRDPSRRDGMIGSRGRFFDHWRESIRSRGSDRPSGTGCPFGRVPGNKLPGYDHDVPTGPSPTGPVGTKTTLTPVRIFDSISLRAAGFEDEDENEAPLVVCLSLASVSYYVWRLTHGH